MKIRFDKLLYARKLVNSRSQAEDLIRRGLASVEGETIVDPGRFVQADAKVRLKKHSSFVSRAGEKLNSALQNFAIDFKDKIVLDVGSSTGGFTEVALEKDAKKVIAVEKGTRQMRSSLARDPRVELHEKTDIRDVCLAKSNNQKVKSIKNVVLLQPPDIILIDVSFVSLRQILPHIAHCVSRNTVVVAMLKPQFEAREDQKHDGVIKNSSIRRQILKDFETWLKSNNFLVQAKRDSELPGAKGNVERFYLLQSTR